MAAITACGPSPKEVTEQYLEARSKGDAAKAHALVHPEDQVIKSVEKLKSEWEADSADPVHKAFGSKSAYEILDSAKEGDKATVQVRLTGPDYEAMRKDGLLIAKAMSQAKDDKAKEEELLQKFMVEKFTEEGPPMMTEEQTFHLARVEKRWYLALGWKEAQAKADAEARSKAEREMKMKIHNDLLAQARQARLFGDYAKASKLLEDAIKEYPQGREAAVLAAEVKQEQARMQSRKPYLDGLRVSAVKVSEVDTPKGKLRVVKGKVTNATPQSFRVVTLGVDLLDSKGQPVTRELFSPWDMDTLSGSSPRARSPFSPNYVHDFQYTILSSSMAADEKVRVTAVDCVLVSEPARETGANKGYQAPAGGSLESMQRKK